MQLAISGLPPPLQPIADRSWQRIAEQATACSDTAAWPEEAYSVYARMLACSDYVAAASLRQWRWFSDAVVSGRFEKPPQPGLRLQAELAAGSDIKKPLREYRNRRMLHILWREFSNRAVLDETLASLSALADELLIASRDAAVGSLAERFGVPMAEGREIPLVILAMGKLGGCELNFSSDIDIVFLYTEDGETNGNRRLSAHEYFTRLTRRITNLLDDLTEDGFVFRVDTRLRPFGDSGPPVVSYSSLESYLLRHGRAWERYAYVKARVVGEQNDSPAVRDLMDELIQPFVYRRYLDYGVFESLRNMKSLIEAEVRKRELASNIKLGPGGIREIEFIVQALQLVRGGTNENLRRQDFKGAVQELEKSRILSADTGGELRAAYRFLRRVENFIQAVRDEQTHELPQQEADRIRLAFALQYDDWQGLVADLDAHRTRVNQRFNEIAFRSDGEDRPGPATNSYSAAWETATDEELWRDTFAAEGHSDPDVLARTLVSFARHAQPQKLEASAQKRLAQFIPLLLSSLRRCDAPTDTLRRLLAILQKILRRSAYIALLNENPAVLQRLVDLCAQSAYFADEIARFPLLLDEMLDPRLFTAVGSATDMRADLEERLQQVGDADRERQVDVLAQYQRATLFRIAIAELSGDLPIMKVSDALTVLAEVIVASALEFAWRDLVQKHGEPRCEVDGVQRSAGFGVIAYGKLGGMELSYGSDLDLVFLHDSQGERQLTSGDKTLDNSLFFARLVRRLVHFLTTQTMSGTLYDVDTRLRPSGRSGLLVTSVDAFERYQNENAWTWEKQALLRSRSIAGEVRVNRAFERIRKEVLSEAVDRNTLAGEVKAMRARMRQKLDKSTNESFDLKQGSGGLGDLEFLVQFLALASASANPAVIHFPDNIRQLAALAAAGCLAASEVAQLQEIYRAYRVRLHRLALDGLPPIVGSGEFPDERQFVRLLWEREFG